MPDYKGNISQVYNLLKTNGATNQSEADFARDMANSPHARLKVYGQLKKWGTQGLGSGYDDFAKMLTPNVGGAKPQKSVQAQQAQSVGQQAFGEKKPTALEQAQAQMPQAPTEQPVNVDTISKGQVSAPAQTEKPTQTEKPQSQSRVLNDETLWDENGFHVSSGQPSIEEGERQAKESVGDFMERFKKGEAVRTHIDEKGRLRTDNTVANMQLDRQERNKAVRDNTVGKDIDGIVDTINKEAEDKWRQEVINYTNVVGADPETAQILAKENVDPDRKLKQIQETFMGNISEYLKAHTDEYEKAAQAEGISTAEYVDKYIMPYLGDELQKRFSQKELEKYMPKNMAEYIFNGLQDTIPGMLTNLAYTTQSQRAYQEQANAQYIESLKPQNGSVASEKGGFWDEHKADIAEAGRFGQSLIDPLFAGGMKGGAIAGRGLINLGSKALSKIGLGRVLASDAMKAASIYAKRYGSHAAAGIARVLGSNEAVAKTILRNMPAEMLGQGLGMNIYGALQGGLKTATTYQQQFPDDLTLGEATWQTFTEGLTSREGFVSGAVFGGIMPFMHEFGGLVGHAKGATGWARAKGIAQKSAYEVFSIGATAAAMQLSNETNKWLGGEGFNPTLNGYMHEVAMASAMKYNPSTVISLARAINNGGWKRFASSLGESTGLGWGEKYPFRFTVEEEREILRATGKTNLKDALLSIFPDNLVAKGSASQEEVVRAQTRYLQVLNRCSWDTQNKLAMGLTNSFVLERPRCETFKYAKDEDGNNLVLELDKDGNVLSVKAFKSEEEKEAFLTERSVNAVNEDFWRAYSDARAKDPELAEQIFDTVCANNNLSREEVENVLKKAPLRRTDLEWDMLEQIMSELEGLAYPKEEAHVEHSRIEGEKAAQEAQVTSETPNTETVNAVNNEVTSAQVEFENAQKEFAAALEEAKKAGADWVNAYERMKAAGMSDAEILDAFNEGKAMFEDGEFANPEDWSALDSFVKSQNKLVNAQAKQQGFMEAARNEIEQKTSEQTNLVTSGKVTINGVERTDGRVITLVDADGNIVRLLSGDFKLNEDGTIETEQPIVVSDDNGNPRPLNNVDGWKVAGSTDAGEYASYIRELLGQKATAVIDPEGQFAPKPEAPKTAQEEGSSKGVTTEEERRKSEGETEEKPKPEPAPEAPIEPAPTQPEAPTPEPPKAEEPKKNKNGIPIGEDGEPNHVADGVKPMDAVNDIYNGGVLSKEEADGYVDEKIEEAQKAYDEANKPISRNKGEGLNAYAERKAQHEAEVEQARQTLERWKAIYDDAHKFDVTKEDIENPMDFEGLDTSGMENTPEYLVASNMPKITPESFNEQVGLGAAEKRKNVGMIAKKENGGVDIDTAVLRMRELYPDVFGGADGENRAKNIIIDILSSGGSRSYIKRLREKMLQEEAKAQAYEKAKADKEYLDNYGMEYDEYKMYEQSVYERIADLYRGVDEKELDKARAEQYLREDEEMAAYEADAKEVEQELTKTKENGRKDTGTEGRDGVLSEAQSGNEGGHGETAESSRVEGVRDKVQDKDGSVSGAAPRSEGEVKAETPKEEPKPTTPKPEKPKSINDRIQLSVTSEGWRQIPDFEGDDKRTSNFSSNDLRDFVARIGQFKVGDSFMGWKIIAKGGETGHITNRVVYAEKNGKSVIVRQISGRGGDNVSVFFYRPLDANEREVAAKFIKEHNNVKDYKELDKILFEEKAKPVEQKPEPIKPKAEGENPVTPETPKDRLHNDKLPFEERIKDTEPLKVEDVDGLSEDFNGFMKDQVKSAIEKLESGQPLTELEKLFYLNALKDVRDTDKRSAQDSTDADRAQLAQGDNASEHGGNGSEGVEATGLDREGGRETPEGQPSGENSEDGLHQSSGSGGDRPVRSAESADDGVSGASMESEPSGNSGSDGRNVRQRKGEGISGTTPSKATRDDIKSGIEAKKKKLAEIAKRLKKTPKNTPPRLYDVMSALGAWIGKMGDSVDWKAVGEFAQTTLEIGADYFKLGVHDFKEWARRIKGDLAETLKDTFGWGDAEVDDFIREMWNSKYTIDGKTHTIGQWASIIGDEALRKEIHRSLDEKREQQKAAESIEVKVGDRDNIDDTLPYLLPEQRDDVYKAEMQFFDKKHQDREHGNGKGMMFTNGTGTGKTYTGLGIVKRFVKQGKGRVLIVTPSQTKVSDWVKDGANLGLEVVPLENTKDAGKDVVCTTYANLRANEALLRETFDLIMYDESHKIMENKKGEETIGTQVHYQLSNKNQQHAVERVKMKHEPFRKEKELRTELADVNETLQTAMKKLHELGVLRTHGIPECSAIYDREIRALENATDSEVPKRKEKLELLNIAKSAVERRMQIPQEIEALKPEQEKLMPEIEKEAADAVKRTKTVFLSATPFNTRESLKYAEGYIFSYPEENKATMGSYNHRSPEQAFLEQTFGAGYRWRYGRLEQHTENPEALSKQEVQFSEYLQQQLGTLSTRTIKNGYDYSRTFPTVTLDKADRFNQALQDVMRDESLRALAEPFRQVFYNYNKQTALFESMKTALAAERIKEHLARGRKVVVFHRRRTSNEDLQNPFAQALAMAHAMAKDANAKQKAEIGRAISEFESKYDDLLKWEQGLDYRLPREQLADIFGAENVAFFSGEETKKTKQKSVDEFMKDNEGKNIIVVQEASGKEGISLHDQTGAHQRVQISLCLPQSPIAFIQSEGRIFRIGQKSNAIFEYPLLGLNHEINLWAHKFNSSLGTTENLAMGNKARNLSESIARGVLENSGVLGYDEVGVGGREFDGNVESAAGSGFDGAILDYYGTQKLRGRRDNREGKDYYPTPEPIGYKMVEWAYLTEGETALEPSAGHGAIARYVPKANGLTMVEPSQSLMSKLALNTPGSGRKYNDGTFEQYDLHNKHDVVVMNPPYGVGGATAVEHVAKAFKHLNEGGRVIAIIPDGTACEKKLGKWIASKEGESAVVTAEVRLPSCTFGRAGTEVNTRIVVIDKVTRPEAREGMPKFKEVDLRHIDDVKTLFEELRDIDMPRRTIDKVYKRMKIADNAMKKLNDPESAYKFAVSFAGATDTTVRIDFKDRKAHDIFFSLDNIQDNPQMALNAFANYMRYRDGANSLTYPRTYTMGRGSSKVEIRQADIIHDVYQSAMDLIAKVAGTTSDKMEQMVIERQKNPTADAPKTEPMTAEPRYKYEVVKHGQTGADLHIVKNKERMSYDEYKKEEARAKQLGGFYDRYSKGFRFESKEAAEKFISEDKGGAVQYREGSASKTDVTETMKDYMPENEISNVENVTSKEYEDALSLVPEERRGEVEERLKRLRDILDMGLSTQTTNATDKNGNVVFRNMGLYELISIIDKDVKRYERLCDKYSREIQQASDLPIGQKQKYEDALRDARGMWGEARAKQALAYRAVTYAKAKLDVLSKELGISPEGEISLDDISRMFSKFNSDDKLHEVFDNVLERLRGLSIAYGTTESFEKLNTQAGFDHGKGTIKLRTGRLLGYHTSKQETASTILHEMIHPLTSDPIRLYELGGKYRDMLNPEQQRVAKEVIDLFNKLKKNEKDFLDDNGELMYGLTRPTEFLNEAMSDLAFRERLKGKGVWDKIKEWVKSLFGISDMQKAEKLFNDLLRTYDLRNKENKALYDWVTANNEKIWNNEPQAKKIDASDKDLTEDDKKAIADLNSGDKEKTKTVYRAMQVIDGMLYPPMAARIEGELVEGAKSGDILKADEHPELIKMIDGKPKFVLDKGGNDATGKKASSVPARYNPYWHTSNSPMNDQFKSAWIRPNMVTVECEIPVSELTSGYKAEFAKDAVGMVPWKSGSVTGELVKQGHPGREVYLSRYCKIGRVLSDAETAEKIKEFIGDKDVSVPENVVTPKVRQELEKLGVKIGAPEKGIKKSEQIKEAIANGLEVDNTTRFSEDLDDSRIQQLKNGNTDGYNEETKALVRDALQGRKRVRGEFADAERRTCSEVQLAAAAIAADRGGVPQAGRRVSQIERGTKEEIERGIEDYAKANDAWFDEKEIAENSQGGSLLAEGGENRVYLSKDGKTVTKVLEPYMRNENSMYVALRNIKLFNELFPNAAITVKGLLRDGDGKMRIVTEQPYIQGMNLTRERYEELGVADKAREYFKERGLEDVYGDALEFKNDKYYVRDIHYGNIILDKNGVPQIFDANVTLHKAYEKEVRKDGFGFEQESGRMSEGEATPQPEDKPTVRAHIDTVSKDLNTPCEVHNDASTIKNEKVRKAIESGRKVKGWWDKDGVHLYMPNIHSQYEAEKTILHETVGHDGLRKLMNGKDGKGRNFEKFLDMVWADKSNKALHEFVKEYAPKNGWDIHEAVDEWLAREAEKPVSDENFGMWSRVKAMFRNALRALGWKTDMSINDVRYAIWLSKRAKQRPDDPLFKARAAAFRWGMKHANYKPAVENGRYVEAKGKDGNVRFSASLTPSARIVKDELDRTFKKNTFRWRETLIDNLNSFRRLQEKVSGKSIYDIPDAENAYVAAICASSIAETKWNEAKVRFLKPITNVMDSCVGLFGGDPKETQQTINTYLFGKSAFERNRKLFVRDAIKKIEDATTKDHLQQLWDAERASISAELKSGAIDYYQYLEKLDNFIKSKVDSRYDPNKNDYSGISCLDPNRTVKGRNVEYDEKSILDDIMNTESMLGDKATELWDAVKQATDYSVDRSFEVGMVDSATRDHIKDMFDFYVPMRGFAEETMEDVYDYRGDSNRLSSDSKVIKRADGRHSLPDDALAYISMMAKSAIVKGEQNLVLQRFLRMASKNESDALKVSELWEEKVTDATGKVTWETRLPDIPDDAPTEKVAEIVEKFIASMEAMKAKGNARKVTGRPKFDRIFKYKHLKTNHAVPVYVGGKMKVVYVLGNPRPADAIMGRLANDPNAKTYSISELPGIGKWYEKVFKSKSIMRTRAGLTTSYNLNFISSNTTRDTLFANANIASKESFTYWRKFLWNQVSLGAKLFGEEVSGLVKDKENLFQKLYRGHLDMSNPLEKDFAEFMDNGGRTGYVALLDVEKMKDEIQTQLHRAWIESIKNTKGVGDAISLTYEGIKTLMKNLVGVVGKSIETVNMRAELLNRFATFVTSRQMGRTIQRSVYDAKESTVNFSRHGAGSATGGPIGNVGAFLINNKMFFNPGIQALNLIYENMQMGKSQALRTVTNFYGIPLVAGTAFVYAIANLFDIDEYAKIPAWKRRSAVCIPIKGEGYVSIPLSYDQRATWGMADVMASQYFPQLGTEEGFALDMASQVTQLLPIDVLEGGSKKTFSAAGAVDIVAPTTINDLFFEPAFNISWNGTPIQKENKYFEDAPEYTKAFSSTNPYAVKFCKWLHQNTRENKNTVQELDVTAKIDLSPAKIDYVSKQFLGGLYTITAQSANAITADEQKISKYPIASTVWREFSDKDIDQTTNAKYWSYKREAENFQREEKNLGNKKEVNPLGYEELRNSPRKKRSDIFSTQNMLIKSLEKRAKDEKDPEEKAELQKKISKAKYELVLALDMIE